MWHLRNSPSSSGNAPNGEPAVPRTGDSETAGSHQQGRDLGLIAGDMVRVSSEPYGEVSGQTQWLPLLF